MIIGPCPYCDAPSMIPIAPKTPAFSKEECDNCGKEFWLLHSKWNPEKFTLEEFAEKYDVNEETRQITRKDTKS
jgi:hypothetical protein